MKILYQKRRQSEQGFALLMTLGVVVILGITIGSYLLLVSQEEKTVVRSERWNTALTMAEAGVEEALAQMNASPKNFSANGWVVSSGTNYAPNSSVPNRTLTVGSYTVKIAAATIPTIYSTGYASVPGTSQQVSRSVKVTAQTEPLFSVGLGSVNSINMNGNGVSSDSWNSHSTNQSNNGLYNGYVGTNGSVASEQGLVNIGNHTIDGNLYLGPNASYGGSGTVSGTIYTDYNVQFPPPVLPTSDTNGNSISWLPATVSGGTNTFTTGGYYFVNNSNPIYVKPGVNVTLHVQTQSFNPSTVTIGGGTTNSATLVIYHDPTSPGGSMTLGGNSTGGAIGNRPQNFLYFGLPNVASITLSGTSDFVGAIYAPTASLTLNGGGHGNNLMGSAIVSQVTLNGHYDFHYDESLATYGPPRGFIPITWQEL